MIVNINDKKYTMRYTVNSLCALEDRAGMPIDRLMKRQFSATRFLLWAGLVEEQPELTVKDVSALIGDCVAAGGCLTDIVDMCTEGLREAEFFGDEAKGDAQ